MNKRGKKTEQEKKREEKKKRLKTKEKGYSKYGKKEEEKKERKKTANSFRNLGKLLEFAFCWTAASPRGTGILGSGKSSHNAPRSWRTQR